MLNAFEVAAGYSAYSVSLFMRSFYGVTLTFWMAWIAYRQYMLMAKDPNFEIGQYGSNMLKLVFLWTFLMFFLVVT